ncbi:thrombospondin type-1 domain-containing protein 7A-like [Pundamilia nyererei]|uniref:Thrombospondin type-1 domain-containing protein 7A-like n=1 Tax=Pundamilia nyererei TaxID=303518 RepID=A0A9Y6M4B8_9CICH|nr:PREDICTED: thrombospondin type-1 domain-containing protein 7A-like [Pundamilia nyererei]
MGTAGRGIRIQEVLKGAPLLSLWTLALLFLSMWELDAQTAVETRPMYIWRTGPWGRCMGSECGPGGSQSRAVWCAHSEGWTTLHTNCDQAERPDNQQSCFRVCDWHKELYDWQLGAWNQCVPVMRSARVQRPTTCTQGEEGIQTREVGCVQKAKGEPAEDAICEYFEPKPRLEQACLIPCPQDCVVSEFSPWTPCSKTCGIGLQNRIRFVLAPPLFGGAACPNLTEFQTCQLGPCQGEESLYSLRVGPWGPCTVPLPRQTRQADKPPRESEKQPRESDKLSNEGDKLTKEGEKPPRGDGKQTREGEKQLKEGDKQPKDGENPLKSKRKLGRGNRNRKSDRPSLLADRPKRQKKAKNKEKREKLREKVQERLRERGKAKDAETRELIKKKRNKNRQNRPGGKFWDLQTGFQTREVTCVHKSGAVEALSLCSQETLPVTFQACVITKDCDVTEWSKWSACTKECYDPTSPKAVWTRTRKVTQFPVGGGIDCPELEEKEPCTPQSDVVPPCNTYSWKTTEWTECKVDMLLSQQDRRRGNHTGMCGGGTQTREVYCVQASTDTPSNLSPLRSKEALRPVDSKLCLGIPPNTTQLCHISCPVDCEVSSWSTWGPCTYENCQDQVAKKGFKLRKRRIINEPTGGTGNCPHLVEAIPCEDPSCYDWLVVKLEDCIPDNEEKCGPGIQIPQVQCVNSDGEHVDRKLCQDAILPMPFICEVPCPKDCALSPWSSWSLCSHTCSGKNTEGKQTRTRSILAYNAGEGGVQCPNISALQEVRRCNDHPCTVYHWQTGPWGQCIEDSFIPSTNTSVGRTRGDDVSCSVGMQTRKVICVRVNVGQVPPKKCPESVRPDTVRPCLLPCKRDCIVTPYSDWSPCPSTCQTGGNTKKKQYRKRLIIQLPANGGQDCPEVLTQERDCETPSVCEGYRWKTHKWRRCQLVPWSVREGSPGNQELCGLGLQVRAGEGYQDTFYCAVIVGHKQFLRDVILSENPQKVESLVGFLHYLSGVRSLDRVWCMLNTIDGPSEQVEDYLCDPEEMPLGARKSHLPCPEDCVLSDWGAWSPCPLPCSENSTRERSAYPLRQPGEKKECPPTEETEPCKLNRNCFHYTYNITEWSTCQLSDKAVCGNGFKTRMLDCVRSDGKSVDLVFCKELGLERKWQMNASCVVECPVNCQLSDWSPWSGCSHTCGLAGKLWRRRTVVQAPQGDGRPCPSQMEQWKPCLVKPCYRWRYSAWSECKSEGARCGEGLRFRNVSCFVSDGSGRQDGSAVDDELCGDLEPSVEGNTQIVLQEPCTVPCPGECYLTDWTVWSSCQLSCINGADLGFGSVQVRSRAVVAQDPENLLQCPEQELEARPCTDGECFDYKWKSGPWRGSSRHVWCERSDGLNVTGGCLTTAKPKADRSCNPPCTKPQSLCTEAGVCGCEDGYTEVMTSDGLLDQCTVIPVLEIPTAGDNKADVKTIRGFNPTQPAASSPGRAGRTWFLQPFGPDGKLKTWVYGVAAGAFVLLVFIISMTYLACKKPKKPQRRQMNNRLKPLTLAYDGDADM